MAICAALSVVMGAFSGPGCRFARIWEPQICCPRALSSPILKILMYARGSSGRCAAFVRPHLLKHAFRLPTRTSHFPPRPGRSGPQFYGCRAMLGSHNRRHVSQFKSKSIPYVAPPPAVAVWGTRRGRVCNPLAGGSVAKSRPRLRGETSLLRRNGAAASDLPHLGRSIRSLSTSLFADVIISRCAFAVCSRLITLQDLSAPIS
jgi:hypothetical protein